jgi:hypothetical protein
MTSSLPLASITNFVSVKLDGGNYLLWRDQLESILISTDLLSHIDGSEPIPSKTIETTTEPKTTVPNPKYITWRKTDHFVKACINATLTESLAGQILNQNKYTLDLLQETSMLGCKPCSTPVIAGSKLSTNSGSTLSDPQEYRRLVGSLQYLTLTRPDICYAVNQVCQFMQAPRTEHLVAVKRILRYLKGTIGQGITIRPGPLSLFGAFCDADWAGCPDTRRSTTGFCTYLGPNLISWGSKKQPTVSRSSAEAEYKALAITASELMWLSYLLSELHIPFNLPIVLHCDNKSALHMAANPILHARTKHIEIDYHFVRDLVVNGTLCVRFVRSGDQLADIFTQSNTFQ